MTARTKREMNQWAKEVYVRHGETLLALHREAWADFWHLNEIIDDQQTLDMFADSYEHVCKRVSKFLGV